MFWLTCSLVPPLLSWPIIVIIVFFLFQRFLFFIQQLILKVWRNFSQVRVMSDELTLKGCLVTNTWYTAMQLPRVSEYGLGTNSVFSFILECFRSMDDSSSSEILLLWIEIIGQRTLQVMGPGEWQLWERVDSPPSQWEWVPPKKKPRYFHILCTESTSGYKWRFKNTLSKLCFLFSCFLSFNPLS